MTTITGWTCRDIRFPTSKHADGSDAMNPDPDYSAAYVVLETDGNIQGHGLTFTLGKGTELCVAAVNALAPNLVGRKLEDITAHMGAWWQKFANPDQLRWVGPEKGVLHLAVAALVNAVWDLWGKVEKKPIWRLVADLTPEQFVDLIDFRYITDALTPEEALDLLRRGRQGTEERTARLLAEGYPAYTTSAGWLGYSDEKLTRLAAQAVTDGFRQIKLKVGADLADDVRRCRVARSVVGPDVRIAIDANQRWNVDEAITWTRELAEFDPYWIEEPTSPDDVLGHAAIRKAVTPVKVATGEHVQNRIVFKQMLQAGAIDVLQIDAARVAGVNENLAILLLAAKYGVPVCPHAGGVGLCELVQHLSMFDLVALSGTTDDRVIEYVDHLHEHFIDPVVIREGRYSAPTSPGFSAAMRPESIAQYTFPGGTFWAADLEQKKGHAA